MITTVVCDAEVSELADEQDSGSCERYAREGSSPFFRRELYAPNPAPKGDGFGFTVQSSYKEKLAVSFEMPLFLLYIIPCPPAMVPLRGMRTVRSVFGPALRGIEPAQV